MSFSAGAHLPTSNSSANPGHRKSSFGIRFHKKGQPNVYFRTNPDLTSDPNQVWVSLDTSELKFQNYSPNHMPSILSSASSSPEQSDDDDPSPRAPKRQKKSLPVHSRAIRGSASVLGFRVDKPLKADIHIDVWRIILKESHPTVLLIAKNLNKDLYSLLQEQSVWKASREKLHGTAMPGPPGDISEQRYAHLLYGQGCDFQRTKCGSSVTKKIYWPFLLRMCDACFRRKVEKDKALRGPSYIGWEICDLIPAGMTSSGKYIRTRRVDGSGWENLLRAVYLRSDYEAIAAEYREKVQMGQSTTQLEAWKEEKRAKARLFMSQCTLVEKFYKDWISAQPRHREARAEFFIAQASDMTPPLRKKVLERMVPFKMSLDSNHEPTLRSWSDLKKKLLPIRAETEALLNLIQEHDGYEKEKSSSSAIRNFCHLHSLRSHLSPSQSLLPEQAFIMDLGRQELRRCKDHAVADSDLLLLVLKGVYDVYQSLPLADRPEGTNIDLSRGPYRLTIDDARMIVENVVTPEVRSWNDETRSDEALEKFKCIGCVRKDCTTRYSFTRLFHHIREKHAMYVAEGDDFHKLYRPFDNTYLGHHFFSWYTVEWPRNLPIAASHQEVGKVKKWQADADVPYIPLVQPTTISAFLNRRASDNHDISPADFAGNLAHAAGKLRATALNFTCQMRITLQYALDRYAISHAPDTPSLADFIAHLPKIQGINEDFTLNFGCGVCKHKPDIPHSAMHTRPEPLHKLKEHFDKTHSTHDWTTSLMDLPSDVQVARLMQDSDKELRKEKQAKREREASLAKNPRKKADPIAKVILQKPEAMAVFDQLFPMINA